MLRYCCSFVPNEECSAGTVLGQPSNNCLKQKHSAGTAEQHSGSIAMNVPFLRICFSCLLLVGAASYLPAQESTAVADLSLPATDEGLPGAGPVRRADWFVDLWQKRRSAFASRADQERGAVVFLGDSITQGWDDDFRGALAGMKLANRGISGDTTRGMLIRLSEDVLELDPACVVMLMGTNDIEMGATPQSRSPTTLN